MPQHIGQRARNNIPMWLVCGRRGLQREGMIGTQLEKVRCLKCSFFQDLGCETKDLSTAPVLWQN